MGAGAYSSVVRGWSLHGERELDFSKAVGDLRDVVLRPEVRLTEVPAPGRIAPYAAALTGEVFATSGCEDELASGRFVLLHDPDCPEPWEGAWRVVSFARAQLEPELATDPFLGEVGWAWLVESLRGQGLEFVAEAGTVTRVVSESFGALAERTATVDIEVRASWSPVDARPGRHLRGWADLLCTLAGLPPLPDGVVALPGQRR